ncbi:hypothetical protein F5Y13DRAFT_205023 [Hypoxylon sp. FL1857]|nr:hypothetical protein F5Y13DRAFT_205023 [Hypoxylon sp. FL1857]
MAATQSIQTSPPQRPRFRLEFRVVSDGLETAEAQALNVAGTHAHGGQFPLFAQLPAELRLKIWEYFLAPRIVAIACLDATAQPPLYDDDEPEEPWTSFPELEAPAPPAVPVLLLVNRETRALALKHYAPAFSWKVPYVLLHADPPPPNFSSTCSVFPSAATSSSSYGSTWSGPRVWFDYARDAVYLLGELEPCDSYGFNSPMAYFLDREEALKVKRLAVAFAALRYGESGSQHIFGALFHVVDRFARLEEGEGEGRKRVLVAVAPRDELTHALMGGEGPLVREDGDGDGGEVGGSGGVGRRGKRREGEEVNLVQKIWRDWYRGSIVTSSLANIQFELVRESDLPQRIARGPRPPTVDPSRR